MGRRSSEEDDYDYEDDDQSMKAGEEEEEFREVDPIQVVEDRLMVLEAWLHEDPYQEDVSQKRDEYLSLMEELEILGKKMRKTDKLLAVPNQPNVAKLERKRDQYEREVTDIVLYAEQDVFFDLEGEHGEAALNAFMKANSLLGKPLETLAEMSGFEDSKAWNDSFGHRSETGSISGDTCAVSITKSPSSSHRGGRRSITNAAASVSQLDMSKSHNVTVMKKKMKKAKQLLEDATSESDRKKLLKKIQEYKEALDRSNDGSSSSKKKKGTKSIQEEEGSSHDDDATSNASEESIEPPLKSPPGRPLPTIKTSKKADDDQYRLLKKKLTKVLKMIQESSSKKDIAKYQKKVDEYVTGLNKYSSWKQDQSRFILTTLNNKNNNKNSKEGGDEEVEEDDEMSEDKWLEQQAEADEERLMQKQQQEEATQRRRTQAKTMLASSLSSSSHRNSTTNGHATTVEMGDKSLDLEQYIEEERKQSKLLRKKVQKVESMLEDMLDKKGDDARYTKEFRKLQKKRKQYLSELGEDHASLANLSLSGASLDASSSMSIMNNVSGHGGSTYYDASTASVDISTSDLGGSSSHHHPSSNSNNSNSNNSSSNNVVVDATLIRKKLKKLEKMLKETKRGSKDHDKLLKKKNQYLAELGEAV